MNPAEYAKRCQAQEVQEVQKVQEAQEVQQSRRAPAGIVGKRQADYDNVISFYRDACGQLAEARDRARENLIHLNKMIQHADTTAVELLAVAVEIIADGLGERPLRVSFAEWKKNQDETPGQGTAGQDPQDAGV